MKNESLKTPGVENRKHTRFKLHMGCIVYSDGTPLKGAQTVDISKEGVSIRWRRGMQPPKLRDPLLIEIQLPEHPSFGSKCMFFHTEVVRVTETSSGEVLVAARAQKSGIRQFSSPLKAATAAHPFVN